MNADELGSGVGCNTFYDHELNCRVCSELIIVKVDMYPAHQSIKVHMSGNG